jgi:glycosyltransferase involved in cell wall biosynthesis
VVIPNGFDLRLFASSAAARTALRARWQAVPAELLVGMVARVDPMKDHATFIRAAALVAQQLPQARFVLVGEGVSRDPAIRSLLTQTQLSGRFILEERRADVRQVMSALDVFCLASLSEGFPNVLGEAMACALPAVGTDVGDVRDILQDERLVAPVGDAPRLAACISHVLQLSPEARRALGLRQQQSIATRFDIEQVWQQYRALYASL